MRISDDLVEITFSGLSFLTTRRRTLRIPMRAVRSIKTATPSALPHGETVSPGARQTGILRHGGRVHLLASRPGEPTLTIDLDRQAYPDVRFDSIVVSCDDVATRTVP